MSEEKTITPNPPANYTPTPGTYTSLQPFRYWCQKVLPLVYEDSLSYYELLCKVIDYLNKTMEDVETLHIDVTNLHQAFEQLQTYVNNYFSSLDVQEEINNKLDAMSASGELSQMILPMIPTVVDAWLGQHISNPSNPPLDDTLILENAAAQSKAVGTLCFRWMGMIKPPMTAANLEIGTYGVIKGEIDWLPAFTAGSAWVTVFNGSSANNPYFMLTEASRTSPTIWLMTIDNTWVKMSDPTLSVVGIPADAKATGDLCMRWKGMILAGKTIDDLQPGVYGVIKGVISWLPAFTAGSAWVVVLNDNSASNPAMMLIEASRTSPTVWLLVIGGVWVKMADDTLSLPGMPADSLTVGQKCMRFKGMAGDAPLTELEFGVYGILRTNASAPPKMKRGGGYLFVITPGASPYCLLIEQTKNPVMWFYAGNNWTNIRFTLNEIPVGFIGDSITEYNSHASENYVKLLVDRNNLVAQNLAQSGSGFYAKQDTNGNYISRIPSLNNSNKLICVSGSFNDLYGNYPLGTKNDVGSQSIGAYMNAFFSALETAKPSTPIICYTLNYWGGTNPDISSTRQQAYIKLLSEVCYNRGIPFLNIGAMCNIKPWINGNASAYTSDKIHPNNEGQLLLYPIIYNWIKTFCTY